MVLDSFVAFLQFFGTAIVLVGIFLYLYAIVTPYDDYEMIFNENNIGASLGFGGAIIGVSIPLYSALVSSVSFLDFVVWGVVAITIQLIFALLITRCNGKYSFTKQISDGNISAGLLMAFLSISIGLINAGSMSY